MTFLQPVSHCFDTATASWSRTGSELVPSAETLILRREVKHLHVHLLPCREYLGGPAMIFGTFAARLGYTLKNVDREIGIVHFETGMSMSSYAGQSMSVHVLDIDDQTVQDTISGTMKAHGAQVQIYDWGEGGKIATKVFLQLDESLGKGKLISEETASGFCFVATVVSGDYSLRYGSCFSAAMRFDLRLAKTNWWKIRVHFLRLTPISPCCADRSFACQDLSASAIVRIERASGSAHRTAIRWDRFELSVSDWTTPSPGFALPSLPAGDFASCGKE